MTTGGISMGEMVYDDSGEMIEWASKIIGFQPRPDVVAIGWRVRGELRAVALYDNFSECDCNMHIASDGKAHWLSRQFLIASFMHPFVQWRLRRVTGLVPAKNKVSLLSTLIDVFAKFIIFKVPKLKIPYECPKLLYLEYTKGMVGLSCTEYLCGLP